MGNHPLDEGMPDHPGYAILFQIPPKCLTAATSPYRKDNDQWHQVVNENDFKYFTALRDKVVLDQFARVMQDRVFIQGMGRFDVQSAYSRLVDTRRRRHKVSIL